MSTQTPEVAAFWRAYLDTLPADHPHRQIAPPEAWGFGDSAEMANELGQLVYDGIKTATCSLLWEWEFDGDPLPVLGHVSIVLDGRGMPLCVIETVELTVRPFNEVDEQFASDEGEGERTLAYWREGHSRFFGRSCARIGRLASETMPLICERFRVCFRREPR